jgi:enamine deaminase RidA (YjgF/YER057c/UK114 family)
MTDGRRRISSGGPWEAAVGYSRAVVVGDRVIISGTTDAGPDGRSLHPGDAGAQARAAFGIVARALAETGATLDDVVRTRMYLVDRADAAAVTAVHGELFGTARPAATLVLVAGLIDETLRVEVEAEAVLSGAASR